MTIEISKLKQLTRVGAPSGRPRLGELEVRGAAYPEHANGLGNYTFKMGPGVLQKMRWQLGDTLDIFYDSLNSLVFMRNSEGKGAVVLRLDDKKNKTGVAHIHVGTRAFGFPTITKKVSSTKVDHEISGPYLKIFFAALGACNDRRHF